MQLLCSLAALALVLLLSGCAEAPAEGEGGRAASAPRQIGMCATCHGLDGRARQRATPHLGGQDEAYLVASMLQYRDGQRAHAAMRAVAGALSDEDVRALAAWYAKQSPCPEEVTP